MPSQRAAHPRVTPAKRRSTIAGRPSIVTMRPSIFTERPFIVAGRSVTVARRLARTTHVAGPSVYNASVRICGLWASVDSAA
jgi:hypothetical protein